MADPEVIADAECSVLSTAIAYPDDYLGVVFPRLRPEMFVDRKHRTIASALLAMKQEAAQVDLPALRRHLDGKGQLEAAGGVVYLASLFEGAFVPRYCPVNVETIRADWTARRVADLQAEARPDDSADETRARVRLIGELLDESNRKSRLLGADAMDEALHAELRADESERLDLGLGSTIDQRVKGFRPGELFTIVARPKVGKTMLAMEICRRVLMRSRERPVLFYSLELPADAWWLRWLQMWQGVDEDEIVGQRLARAPGLDAIRGMCPNLRVVTDGRPSVADIAADLREYPADLVVIDHADFLSFDGVAGENAADRVRATFIALKSVAKQAHTRVLVLFQGLRGEADGSIFRPPVTRGSSGPEESSDLLLGAWREELIDSATGKAKQSATKQPQIDPTVINISAIYARRFAPFSTRLRVLPECWTVVDEATYHDYRRRGAGKWTPHTND
jgi:replicative DNA helicase